MKHIALLLTATYLSASIPNCPALALETLDLADTATKSEVVNCRYLQKSIVHLRLLDFSCPTYSMLDLSEILYSLNTTYCKGN